MRDLVVNLLASLVAGTAVWSGQRLMRYRRLARKRAFFGLEGGGDCLLTVSRHAASPHELSVHRRDVAAVVELATIVKECGGRADLVSDGDLPQGVGRVTEFCVGGPYGNARTAAHLKSLLRGVRVEVVGADVQFVVGGAIYRRDPDETEYVVLARAWGPDRGPDRGLGRGRAEGRPVFLLAGQTARTNLAAARFLAARHRQLYRSYRASKQFCLVLRVVEPEVYGADFVEIAADVTADAFQPPPPGAAGAPPAEKPGRVGPGQVRHEQP